ncbi:MAG TPA: hypothetical protein VIM63_06450, partial [Rhodoferax sp.]
ARASRNPTDGHSMHRHLDCVCAGRPTALAARVSMVYRTPNTTSDTTSCLYFLTFFSKEHSMNSIVYLVGAVVIIIAVLSFFGMR